ncbi:MAG: glycosyltransferase family 4 protein [Scytonematopsis contorta HA4267-MV1]|nr:glycosyltransferase family 4 protein [Scytonematopsis contorta HA4267-MV1]
MKITVVSHEIPYPANRGARIDIWRRIKAFVSLGVEIQLISWFKESPNPEDITEMQKYCQKVNLIQFKTNLSSLAYRAIDLLSYPLEVTSRIIRGEDYNNLLNDTRDFQPDVIWLDGIHGGNIAAKLSEVLQVPLITRSHNIEHLYYRRLLASTIGFKSKLKRYLSVAHLEKYEKDLLKKSLLFYDISADDFKYWEKEGFSNVRYLPPLIESTQESISPKNISPKNISQENSQETNISPEYDVVFLGALYVDNNIAGVIWFLTQVVPIILNALPNTKFLIAGLNPVDKIKQLCESQPGVDLSINPPSSLAVYNSGRVLINPVLKGSGVSIKSVEMLLLGKPIVSTPQGISGLPPQAKQLFTVADSAQTFAKEIIQLLSTNPNLKVDKQLLESLFGYQVVEKILMEIKSFI